MAGVVESIYAILVSVEFVMGNLGNGFIALVNWMDWIKRRKISSVDQILTALAVSRISLLWLASLDLCASVLCPALRMTGEMTRVIYITWTVANHFNIWLSTSLSIFYFLKIANFSSSTFLYLKTRAKKTVSVMLLVSILFLFLNIIGTNLHVEVLFDGVKVNMSSRSSFWNSSQLSKFLSFTNPIFAFVPFTMSLTTCLLLIFSLWRHVRKMQHITARSRDANTKAHVKALQTVIAFLLLYTIFILLLFLKVWSSESQGPSLVLLFVQAVGIGVLSGLILGNSKLRQAALSVLQWLRCRCKSEGPSDP